MQEAMKLYKTSTCRVPSDLFSAFFILCTAMFNTKNFTFPKSSCINVFIYLSNLSSVIFYASWSVWFLNTKTRYVHYAVSAEFSNKFQVNLRLLCWTMVQAVSCRPLNKEFRMDKKTLITSRFLRLLPLTSPKDTTKIQHIVNQYEQYNGAQFNCR